MNFCAQLRRPALVRERTESVAARVDEREKSVVLGPAHQFSHTPVSENGEPGRVVITAEVKYQP